MRKMKQYLVAAVLFLTPIFASAAAPANFKEFAVLVVGVLQSVVAILFASLAVGLVYGVMLYLANSDNDQKRLEIKGYLLWGVVGVVVVMGIWGILAILTGSIFGGGVGIPQITPPVIAT